MAQRVEIQCGEGETAYTTTLTVDSLEAFQSLAQEWRVKRREGEELVAALLAAARDRISRVERSRNGKLNDGPNGEPAVEKFYAETGVLKNVRYKDGQRNDGAYGEPAIQILNAGLLISVQRFKDDNRNDGPNGEPAMQHFNAAGMLTNVGYWKNGVHNDGANGEPADQIFDDDSGTLIYAARYRGGELVKELNEEERAAYMATLPTKKPIPPSPPPSPR